jgi:5-hydroxyisourate hydrolase-like protein (transthyretin family)
MRYFLFAFCALFFFGCSRNSDLPQDLPRLYPCQITVIQDGKPLTDASITLLAKDKSLQYNSASGMTNSNGIVYLRTYGVNGVPTGDYKITVSKRIEEGATEYIDVSGLKQTKEGTWYSLVELKFVFEETTPLEIEITAGKNEKTIDVGKSVHEKQSASPIQ